MVSPFLTLPLPLWPPEPKSPYLRSGKCLFRCESNCTLRPDSWISNPQPTGGHLSHRNDAVPARNRATAWSAYQRFAAVCRHRWVLPYFASTVLVSSCGVSGGRPSKAASPLTARMYSRCVSTMNRHTGSGLMGFPLIGAVLPLKRLTPSILKTGCPPRHSNSIHVVTALRLSQQRAVFSRGRVFVH